jgi:hypothetical protein
MCTDYFAKQRDIHRFWGLELGTSGEHYSGNHNLERQMKNKQESKGTWSMCKVGLKVHVGLLAVYR